MSRLTTCWSGDRWAKIGYLEQEPKLSEDKVLRQDPRADI